jgi:hypothetical protein
LLSDAAEFRLELLNDDPFRAKRLHCGDRDLLCGPRHLGEIILRDIKDAACRDFGMAIV